MYSSKAPKQFYSNLSSGNTNNTNTVAFTNEGLILLKYYNQNINSYINEINNNYTKLKNQYPNYKLEDGSIVISSMSEIIYSLLLVKQDLQNQITVLENLEKYNTPDLKLQGTKQLTQNSSIKLVYLQYLLLYDISLTNGIFIDIYLSEAQQVLDKNGGLLYHPNK